jgi:hypothetical protein
MGSFIICSFYDIIEAVKSRRMRWVGYVELMEKKRLQT